jgi:hypothetical protein
MVWIDAAEMAADNFAADDPNRYNIDQNTLSFQMPLIIKPGGSSSVI